MYTFSFTISLAMLLVFIELQMCYYYQKRQICRISYRLYHFWPHFRPLLSLCLIWLSFNQSETQNASQRGQEEAKRELCQPLLGLSLLASFVLHSVLLKVMRLRRGRDDSDHMIPGSFSLKPNEAESESSRPHHFRPHFVFSKSEISQMCHKSSTSCLKFREKNHIIRRFP